MKPGGIVALKKETEGLLDEILAAGHDVTYDPARHHRRSIRLKGYDYTRAGAYFVTVCTADRACILGAVVNDTVILSPEGEIVTETWTALPTHYPHVRLDQFVAMPDHVHAIIVLTGPTRFDDMAIGNAGFAGAGLKPPCCETRPGKTVQCPPSPIGNRTGVQNVFCATHQRTSWNTRPIGVATQLLRTRHPRPTLSREDPPLYCRKPASLGGRSPKIAADPVAGVSQMIVVPTSPSRRPWRGSTARGGVPEQL